MEVPFQSKEEGGMPGLQLDQQVINYKFAQNISYLGAFSAVSTTCQRFRERVSNRTHILTTVTK
jgi:hypothetical protein